MSYLGAVVARHSLTTIIITVTIGVSLCLPAPFLYYPTSSVNDPKPLSHAWTSVESFANGENLTPDISIKQVWIYGSRMKALEREVLLEAVVIQDLLLSPMSSCDPESNFAVSFLHSPLLYWNCSAAAIESDNSILTTVNSCAHQISPANITLRPSSIFSGMRFSHNRLVAADTLVVSLLYKADSGAGDVWDKRAQALAQREQSRWKVYPADGRGTGSRLFEFQSRPTSVKDKAIFFGSYSLILLYAIFSLRNARTLKSRVGLFVTIAVQECFSILSGFTLAKCLNIDVSSIPPAVYPFVVLVVGLENMFRLINEVEKTPLEDQSVSRMATALGAVGHLSLITVAQNLFILGLMSRVAPPKLAAFCGFAAISLTVDLVFFFTFFVSILSMDLRKHGLQDSFEAGSTKSARVNGIVHQQRSDISQGFGRAALLYPRPLGTIVVALFLFILGWHWFEGRVAFRWARNSAVIPDWNEFKTTRGHPPRFDYMHDQTRDWVNWLKLQEHETASEVRSLVSPQSRGFLARVYNPLVVVLKSTDRNSSLAEEILTSSPIETIILGPLWLSAVLLCGTGALMLALWSCSSSNDTPEETGNRIHQPGSMSSVQSLPHGHSLDVFILGASSKRILTSVGFDHEIRVWNLESRIISSQLVPTSQQHTLWPVAAIAIDGKAEWLAICSKSGEVSFWNTRLQCFGRSTTINLDTRIVTCLFTSNSTQDGLHSAARLLLVDASGRLTEIDVETANVVSHQICANRVQSTHVNSPRRMPLRLITISEENKIYVTAKREDCWTSHAFDFSVPILNQPSRLRFTIIPDLRMVALVSNIETWQLYLIDLLSGNAIYTFHPRPFNHQTLRAIHSPPQQCLFCGAVALMSFSIAFSEEQDGSITIITLSANPRLKTGLICLRAERDVRERRCIGFGGGSEKTYSMQHAGVWEATRANGVAGIRRKRWDPQMMSETFPRKGTLFRRKAELTQKDQITNKEAWEAWTMTATGIINTHALKVGQITNRAGPICSVGRNAIAVGLAEDIVLVLFGDQLHDDDDDEAVRKPPRTRLAGRSKFGPIDRSGT